MNTNSLIKLRNRGILTLILSILSLPLITSCNNALKNTKVVDTIATETVSETEDTIALHPTTDATPAPPKIFNSFKVKSHEVTLPHITDFESLTSLFDTSKTIKKITFYTPTPSGGYYEMAENTEPFLRAKNISTAKKHSEPIAIYSFDKNGYVTEVGNDALEEYKYSYDDEGHPTKIVYVTEGYRGSPSYTEKYTINWNGDTPVSMTRAILNYENDMEDDDATTTPDEEIPYTYNFKGDFPNNISNAIQKKKPTVIGNSCKIIMPTQDDLPIWCEIEYFN